MRTAVGYNAVNDNCDAFNFWCKNSSINCVKRNSIVYQILPPNFMEKNPVKSTRDRVCSSNCYVVPGFNSIPEALRQLTKENIRALRPFDLDCGVYERESHGYCVKTVMIALKACNIPIEQKIESIVNDSDCQKCLHAYQYLMNSEDFCYSHFVLLREQLLQNSTLLNPFDLDKMKGIEYPLWPNLSPYTDWCESMISGATTR